MRIERELMRGAGPAAVLKLLEPGERYGYELVQRLANQSEGLLTMGQSTLYPLLYNLEAKKLIAGRTDTAGTRPRRYYRLTARGKRELAKQQKQWETVTAAMAALGVTGPRPGGAA
ncbi:PadR family transcriptional regulator [Phycisphaera mikurensis]|uniref:Putative PadR family transcriptional regulator n=1 Tax=Phycisphaera mikurensis (strain NBRC 102666 / KCTC 22515 / FYK2301M01) TaxID=1142394 RepID=I0ICC9_PHYMF|nr:PadR family transcriptional regulator [Phycisphaera mikurensis]MBB6442205.1 PadR family transcriptional regulator PadR [Phycisphaera mikurensis]BAM02917.1 putative PadR family transcriptional regulator [Phycisphaera mikurensis NBRC 102666]